MCVKNKPLRIISTLTQEKAIVFVIVCWCISATYCERRIVNGTLSIGQPKYLVYFVKSPKSVKEYTGWVCGGTIIHPLYILTSAACLDDVKYIYAIAGYNKYVKTEHIEEDECTKRIKNKVVARSFMKDNGVKKSSMHWYSRDISLARVETPYDFRDPVYEMYCSYSPAMIRVNFNSNFEEPGTQAVTFGWGHKKFYREKGDVADHNEEFVTYASTAVIDKGSCKNQFVGHNDIKMHINLYLLCTSGQGYLDERGKINDAIGSFNGSKDCVKRPNANVSNSRKDLRDTFQFYMTNSLYKSDISETDFRRHGPCQNDHGGPLVTWIGGREYVIGVACGFQVNKNMECVGPYLYTSTYSNTEFIYCMLRYARRSRLCNLPANQIIEEEINWDLNNDSSSSAFGDYGYELSEFRGRMGPSSSSLTPVPPVVVTTASRRTVASTRKTATTTTKKTATTTNKKTTTITNKIK